MGDSETPIDPCDTVDASVVGGAAAEPSSVGLLQMIGMIREQPARLEGGSDCCRGNGRTQCQNSLLDEEVSTC